ncbi:MAG: hypothetical protein SPK61_02745 [Bacteroidales bacterium]|nr:hypothetical protein [Bacteroidales bacterium]MDY6426914.1 hypothetical protein [Bacteroidales bacterium]
MLSSVHKPKAFEPIDITLLGISIEVSPLQPLKALSPIDVTLLGISIELNSVQSIKALFPIDVTLLGIFVFLQPETKTFVAVSIIALQLSLESYTVLFLSTVITLSSEHEPKAFGPIYLTLLGISIEVSDEHSKKADSPIDPTPSCINIEARPLQ